MGGYTTAFVQQLPGEFNTVKVNNTFYKIVRRKLNSNIREGSCICIKNGNVELYLKLEIDDRIFDNHVGLSYHNYDKLGELHTGLVEIHPAPDEKCIELVKPTKTRTEKMNIEKSFEWDTIPNITFNNIKGLDYIKNNFRKFIFYLNNPEQLLLYEILPPRAFLLFGPPGCGKTMLARAIANALSTNYKNIRFKIIKSTEIKSKYLGESAKAIQAYFDIARKNVKNGNTVIYFFDEIDSIIPTRSAEDTHKEYVDVVNIFLQELEGANELPTYSKLQELFKDDEVITIREKIFGLAKDHRGELPIDSPKVQKYIQILRNILHEKMGTFSTFTIIGATNNPYQLDNAFISRLRDYAFFIPRPNISAIREMLKEYLSKPYINITDKQINKLAKSAYLEGLTGRDVDGWMCKIRDLIPPGKIMVIDSRVLWDTMPKASVGFEWEIELYLHLKRVGYERMSKQVESYLIELYNNLIKSGVKNNIVQTLEKILPIPTTKR